MEEMTPVPVDGSSCCFLVDSHCHVYGQEYGIDVSAVLARARDAGVRRMLVAGADLPTSRMAVEMSRTWKHFGVFASVGIHPHEARTAAGGGAGDPGTWEELKALACLPGVAAIGETGLDYHYDLSPREQQKESFRSHIRWAAEAKKPLVIHARESYPDLVRILREEGGDRIPGIIHCFSGTGEDAGVLLGMGFHLSFAGPLTFVKNSRLRDLFAEVPPDRFLLETDSPYLAPHPFRGRRNEPALVRLVYEAAARARNTSFEDVSRLVQENAHRLFSWGR